MLSEKKPHYLVYQSEISQSNKQTTCNWWWVRLHTILYLYRKTSYMSIYLCIYFLNWQIYWLCAHVQMPHSNTNW